MAKSTQKKEAEKATEHAKKAASGYWYKVTSAMRSERAKEIAKVTGSFLLGAAATGATWYFKSRQ